MIDAINLNTMTKKTTKLANHFLVAMPTLEDFNFSKSVIYLCEHAESGAMGVVINKPLQIKLGGVLEHLNIKVKKTAVADHPVLSGGPVGQESGFILYKETSPGEQDKIIISSSKEILRKIAKGSGPDDFIITLGYAGWDAGQLEIEIARNDWLLVPFNDDILFTTPAEKRWEETAKLIGVDIKNLSGQIGHA